MLVLLMSRFYAVQSNVFINNILQKCNKISSLIFLPFLIRCSFLKNALRQP